MVVNEAPLTDVVFVVETTANFAPYQELMKSFYLNPILEYLSGRTGPTDDRDIGFDNNYNCSLYAAVWYNTAASAPELTSSCYGPAASTYKLLQLMDKMSFRGGHAESLSHVTEGIATALQCFDDLQEMRESIPSGVNNTIQKHCILFCNSPPYDLPTVESLTYNGMHLDELVAIMAKRDIKFSVISPRKMSFLFKLFEKAGGDLQSALSRKFAKDRRHMVLLSEPNGFNLQERPDSPVHAPAQPSVQPQTSTAVTQPQTPQGVKRPSSPPVSVTSTRPNSSGPAVTAGSSPSLPVQVQTQQQIRAPPPPQFNMRAGTRSPLTVRGQSPSSQQQPIQNNQQPVVQQQSPSVLTARLMTPPQPPNVQMNPTQNTGPVQRMQAPRPPTAAQIRAQQQQQQTGQFQPQPGMNRGPSPRMAAQMAQQQQQMQNQQMQPQNQMQPQSQMQSQNQMQPNQVQGMPMSQGMMNNQMLGNNNQMNQQAGQQQQMTAGRDQLQSMLMQQQPQPQVVQQQQPMQPAMVHVQQQAPQVQQQQPMQGQMRSQQRTIAWTGNIIYEEKTQGPNPQSQIKTPYSLPCQISCFTNAQTGAPEANVSGWPDTLTIQLLPRQMVMKMNTLKNESIHVGLHFQEENIIPDNKPALERLIRIMTTQSAGCVQFTLQEGPGQQPPLRIMIIIYFEEKKAFFGFIPNEQQKFFDQLKNMVQETKRQQMVQQQAQLQQQNPGVRAVMPRVPTPGQPGQVNSPQMNSPQQLQQQLQQPQQMIPQNINIRQAANAGPQFFQVSFSINQSLSPNLIFFNFVAESTSRSTVWTNGASGSTVSNESSATAWTTSNAATNNSSTTKCVIESSVRTCCRSFSTTESTSDHQCHDTTCKRQHRTSFNAGISGTNYFPNRESRTDHVIFRTNSNDTNNV